MHTKQIISAGRPLTEATKALIMIHGRGGSAEDILSLSTYLEVQDYALLAPQAVNHTWYPYSFLAPRKQNEPWLSSALQLVQDTVDEVLAAGIPPDRIYFLGFSQGACLTLEFVAGHARKYGGVMAFTGGLIGEQLKADQYKGSFDSTPIFIGSSDPDPHVPVERVQATTSQLLGMQALVTEKIYPRMGHTINSDEIKHANSILGA